MSCPPRTWPHPVSSCPCSPEQSRLAELEEQAKSAKKGMWSEGTGSHTIRDLKYTIENPRHFVDSMHQKPVNGKLAPARCRQVTPVLHPLLLGGRLPAPRCLGAVPSTVSPPRAGSGSVPPTEPLRSSINLSAFAPQPS